MTFFPCFVQLASQQVSIQRLHNEIDDFLRVQNEGALRLSISGGRFFGIDLVHPGEYSTLEWVEESGSFMRNANQVYAFIKAAHEDFRSDPIADSINQ
jgi:hypothetical protein